MPSEKLHIVGHSLGAQLAGQIGRTITEMSNGLIKLQRFSVRITMKYSFHYRRSEFQVWIRLFRNTILQLEVPKL